jgi:hypothetical protein
MRTQLLLSLALLASSAASAQDLYIGGPDGVILRGHPVFGDFQFAGICGGPIDSMVLDGEDLFIGDTTGNIYHFDSSAGFVNYAFTLSTDATGLVVKDGSLFVSASDGTVLEVDKVTGATLSTTVAPAPIEAMYLRGTMLYVGSNFGVVFRRDLTSADPFTFWGTCGGPIESMSSDDEALILGDVSGAIYRIDFVTGFVSANYGLGGDNTAMVYHQGDILVTSSDGTLRRADAVTGRQQQEDPASTFNLQAMVLREDSAPGEGYCYGLVCPCGNDDAQAGCESSIGVGASLRGTGSSSVAADDLTLFATNVPANKFGVYFMSTEGASATPMGDGVLCSSGSNGFHRFGLLHGGDFGFYGQTDLATYAGTNFGPNAQINAGATWQFQLWYRDPAGPCGSTFNTSNGYLVTFTP